MDGMPTAAQLLVYADNLAALFKASYGAFGLGVPGESNTFASLAKTTQTAIMGDGSSTYGIGAPKWQAAVSSTLSNLTTNCRLDAFWSRYRPLMTALDSLVKNNLPSSWSYQTTANQSHVLDFELTRKNAINPNTPATPTSAGTLVGTSVASGAIPNVSAANAPRVVYTLVSPFDYIESLPSPESTQVSITGTNNAYTLSISGTVPSNVAKVRVYRSYIGGATGAYFWDQDVPVSGGLAYPTITIQQADATLRADIAPPSWMSCLVVPEFASLFALSFAGLVGGSGPLGFGLATTQASNATGLQLSQPHMLSPLNVLAGPASGYLGIGNAQQTAVFGVSSITASNTQTYTSGALQTTNAAAANVQGFAGAAGIQARVTSTLSAGCTVTISYTYLDASHGQVVQTGTRTSSAFSGTAVGTTVPIVPIELPSRLILSATVTAISGAASGAFAVEPLIRTYLPTSYTVNQPYPAPGSAQANSIGAGGSAFLGP